MDMQNEGKGIAQPKGGQYLSRTCRLGSVSFILSHPCSLPPVVFFYTGLLQYGLLQYTAAPRPKGTAQ